MRVSASDLKRFPPPSFQPGIRAPLEVLARRPGYPPLPAMPGSIPGPHASTQARRKAVHWQASRVMAAAAVAGAIFLGTPDGAAAQAGGGGGQQPADPAIVA